MIFRLLSIGLLLSLSLVVGACVTQERAHNLQKSINGYNTAYRWKQYMRAAQYLPAEWQGAFLAAHEEDDKDIQIEGYQILQVTRLEDSRAQVIVRVRYVLAPSVTLEQTITTQHWAYVSGRWILEHQDNMIRPFDPELLKTKLN